MKKIYQFCYNNGDWNGCGFERLIADSLEDAKKHSLYTKRLKNYSCSEPREITSDDICRALNIATSNCSIEFSYLIKEDK